MNNNKQPHGFCETPHENCTMNYCDENGCINRKRNLVGEPIQMNNNMTPKEKAKELYDKYYNVLPDSGDISKSDVQQCALIAVDDILNNFGTLTEGKQHYAAYYTIQYYEQVKQEIENL